MANETPRDYDGVVEHLEDSADGAATQGVAIGLLQNIEAKIRTDLWALIGRPAGIGVPVALPGFKALHNTAKANKTAMTAQFRVVKSNGRALAMICIGTLKPVLGTTWNSAWNAAGFTDGSLRVPHNPMVRLQQLRAYYDANPGQEVASVNGVACTSVACESVAQQISTAQSDSNQSNTDVGDAQANLIAGIEAGRTRITGLREELTQLIGDDDERWYAFGFDKPSDPSTPEVPENLTATPGAPGSGMLVLHCDTARRGEDYRFIVTNAVGGAVLAEKLVGEPETTVDGLPAAANVNITVSAKNGAGETLPSAPIAAVVP